VRYICLYRRGTITFGLFSRATTRAARKDKAAGRAHVQTPQGSIASAASRARRATLSSAARDIVSADAPTALMFARRWAQSRRLGLDLCRASEGTDGGHQSHGVEAIDPCGDRRDHSDGTHTDIGPGKSGQIMIRADTSHRGWVSLDHKPLTLQGIYGTNWGQNSRELHYLEMQRSL
jgi:hypothetical protein